MRPSVPPLAACTPVAFGAVLSMISVVSGDVVRWSSVSVAIMRTW